MPHDCAVAAAHINDGLAARLKHLRERFLEIKALLRRVVMMLATPLSLPLRLRGRAPKAQLRPACAFRKQ